MRIPGLRRLAALVTSAAAVAVATGVVYLAAEVPLAPPPPQHRAPERRPARRDLHPARIDVPLERLSRTHVAVRGRARVALEDGGAEPLHEVMALLDTGLSVPITTPEGERLLGLRVGTGPALVSRGIAGHASDLLPVEEARVPLLALAPTDGALLVTTPVRFLGTDLAEGAHAIVPPHMLGPSGGAVQIDFAASRFAACETESACREGADWARVSSSPCADYPSLVVVAARVGGATARLLLDTGGLTVLGPAFFESSGLGEKVSASGVGEIVVAGGANVRSRIVSGPFRFDLGGPASRLVERLFIPGELTGVAAACHLDGSIGVEALAGCALTLTDTSPVGAWVRCAS